MFLLTLFYNAYSLRMFFLRMNLLRVCTATGNEWLVDTGRQVELYAMSATIY